MNDNRNNFVVNNQNVSSQNNGKGVIIYCSRCGSEVYSNSRYCMKCGNLNPDHPDNKGVVKYLEKVKEGYSVGSGQSLVNKSTNILKQKATVSEVGQHTGGFTLCFVINIVLYLVITGGSFFYYYLLARGDWISIIASNLGDILIGFTLLFFFVYSIELLYMKMDRPWWSSLIPFYNSYVLSDAIIGSGSTITKLSLIPGLGQILGIYVFYKMGPCFKKSGLFTAVLPFIMIPIIAFDGSAYYGTYYTSGENRMEDEFHMKRVFLFFAFLFSAFSVGTLTYTNTVRLKNQAGKLDTAFIIRTSSTVIREVKTKVERDQFTCDYDMDVFYFHFDDVSEYFFVPFAFMHAPVEAYVKVEKVKTNDTIVVGKYTYSISVTNGDLGFPEMSSRAIKPDAVVLYDRLEKNYDTGNDCYLHEKS